MPYIPQENIDRGAAHSPRTAGELNYAFTMLLSGYLKRKGMTYAHINDVLGAFEGAKLEFYRRVVVPYEETKLAENGDVY